MTPEASSYRLPAREIRGDRLAEALFAVTFRALAPSEVGRFLGVNERYALACLQVLEQLGLVGRLVTGYRATAKVEEEVRTVATGDRYLVLGRYATRYKPFVEYVALIHKGYDSAEAARKVNVIYELGVADGYVDKILFEIGLFARLLTENGGMVTLVVAMDEMPPDYFDKLKEATMGEIQARLFVRERLGEQAYQYLGDEQVEDFVQALLTFRADPRGAVTAVGRAVEDFLRTVGKDRGKKDYSKSNGAVEVANLMRSEEPPLLLNGHLSRTHFVGMLRNPGGGHGKDKETLERWTVGPEAAIEAVLVGLSSVRTVHAYVFGGVQAL